MSPLPLILGVAGVGLLLLRSRSSSAASIAPQQSAQNSVTSAQLGQIVSAVSAGPEEMRATAQRLRSAGFPAQAAALESAATAVDRAVQVVPSPPRGSVPVEEVPRPPPGTREPRQPEPPRDAIIIDVPSPPSDAVEVQPVQPTPVDDLAVQIPPGLDPLIEQYARMVYASAPRGPVKDLVLSEEFKRSTGVRGDKKFYGAGPAKALVSRGVIPPTPWDWQQANVAADKASYKANLREAQRNDPARSDAWQAAIDAVR